MLAEGVHSVADSGNQVLLLIGGRRSRQAPSALHPFGYARQRYIYAFLVAVVLFTLGGLYALYEGYHKVIDPHPLSSPLVAVAVLVIAMVLEGYALRTAVREANRTRGTRGWLHFVRRARAPELPVLLLEDSGALVGLTFALYYSRGFPVRGGPVAQRDAWSPGCGDVALSSFVVGWLPGPGDGDEPGVVVVPAGSGLVASSA